MSSAAKLTQSTQPHTPVSSHLSPRISRYTPPSSPSQSRVKRVGGFIVTLPDYRDLYKNLSRTPITSIDHPKLELEDGEEVDIKITDFRAVSSYNWEDQKEPLIIVPGSPRIWQEKPFPFQLSKDRGKVFVDQNSSRLSTSPLLPLIIAVNHHNPKFHMGEMDFITDRNGLRKLYRWVNQSSWTQNGLGGTFRIDIELTGRTILLQRWEVDSRQSTIGYEKNFQSYTTSQIPECEATTGHHRIVSFKFGDKRILMRFTTDACLPSNGSALEDNRGSVDDLADKLTSLNINATRRTRKIATFKGGFLSVKTAGKLVPQESLVELKTKGHMGVPTCYDDLYVQLLLANVSNVYTGRHHLGEFREVEKATLKDIKEKMGEATESNLKLLKKILDEIQRITLENLEDGESLSLVLRKADKSLEVLKRENRDGLLPENILAFIH